MAELISHTPADRRAARMPDDIGVVWSDDHNRQAIYKITPNGSGTKVVITLFGDDKPIAASEQLRKAVTDDMIKRGLYAEPKRPEDEATDDSQSVVGPGPG